MVLINGTVRTTTPHFGRRDELQRYLHGLWVISLLNVWNRFTIPFFGDFGDAHVFKRDGVKCAIRQDLKSKASVSQNMNHIDVRSHEFESCRSTLGLTRDCLVKKSV